MEIAKSFRDLNTYKKARTGAKEIFLVSKSFPAEERYSLTDQIRRSSRATTAMLAEAWARRRYKRAFINKIDEALGEAMETQVWLDHALDAQYLTPIQHEEMDRTWQEVGGMLAAMINRADDFCKNAPDHRFVKEELAVYEL
jgi:four helix bundle protein